MSKELIEYLKEEIKSLKEDNRDLLNRLMAFNSEAFSNYNKVINGTASNLSVASVNSMGELVAMEEPKTEKEKQEYAMAQEQIKQMFGALAS